MIAGVWVAFLRECQRWSCGQGLFDADDLDGDSDGEPVTEGVSDAAEEAARKRGVAGPVEGAAGAMRSCLNFLLLVSDACIGSRRIVCDALIARDHLDVQLAGYEGARAADRLHVLDMPEQLSLRGVLVG